MQDLLSIIIYTVVRDAVSSHDHITSKARNICEK